MNQLLFSTAARTVLLSVLAVLLATPTVAQTRRSIELTLLSDSKTGGRDQQQWLEAMSEVGADRIKVETAVRPRPSVKETEFGGTKLVAVKGVISRGRIKFPGNSFSRSDKTGIRDFLERLRADGMKTTLAEKKAFGLTSEQLVAVNEVLRAPIKQPAPGLSIQEIVVDLLATTPLTSSITDEAEEKLSDAIVTTKLHGLSVGTALAIVLRQEELAFYPRPRQGRGVTLQIGTADVKESWPPGWRVEEAPVTAFPKMFQRIPLQVNQTPLASVLAAIERRLDILFVVDPAALKDHAGNTVDLSKTLVSYNKKKTSYALALSKLLLQAKPRLRHEIRQDENGTRFLWITKQ